MRRRRKHRKPPDGTTQPLPANGPRWTIRAFAEEILPTGEYKGLTFATVGEDYLVRLLRSRATLEPALRVKAEAFIASRPRPRVVGGY